MKNRLQFRYHIPEFLPTRAQAMAYLEEAFAIGRTNAENTTLPAEPLVMLYNDTLVDGTNGMTEAKRLETSNVILAIGRGGDGANVLNNQDYFVIDFAKHDEEITGLAEDVANINEIIANIKDNIDEIKTNILENTNAIAAINSKIGEKGDSCEKDTIYGYIQCTNESLNEAIDTIEDEIARSTQEDEHLNTLIASEKEERIAAVEAERDARIDEDNVLRNSLAETNANVQRIDGELDDEIARATAKEGELEALIIDTGIRLNDEIIRAQTRENELQSADAVLQQNINANTEAINLETVNRTNADAILESKINANGTQIKQNKVVSNGKTILVSGPSENGTNIEVNVDNKTIVINETGTLSVASDALVQYTGENAINVSEVVGATKVISLKVNDNDKVITNDVNGIITTLSLKWVKASVDGEKDEIQLIGKDDIIISRIDVADFIKDGMLDSVKLDTTNPESPVLFFTFNSAAGKETIAINVSDLIDIYYAGNGLTKEENTFSIVIDPTSEEFLTVSSNGLKFSGVKDALNVIVENYQNADNTLRNEFAAADNIVRGEFAVADNTLRNEFAAADNVVRGEFTAADNILRNEFTATNTAIETAYKAADDVVRGEFAAADNVVRGEFAAADAALDAAYKAADALLAKDFATADSALDTKFAGLVSGLDTRVTANESAIAGLQAADTALDTKFVGLVSGLDTRVTANEGAIADLQAADTAMETAYRAADALLAKDFATADNVVRNEFTAADNALEVKLQAIINEKANTTTVEAINSRLISAEGEITNLHTADSQIRKDYAAADAVLKSELNAELVVEKTRAEQIEQELANKIALNETAIAILNGDSTVNGSVKDTVFDAALGAVITTVSTEDATEQSLIKKFVVDGAPFIYASNKTSDMKHNSNALNVVLDDLRNDVDTAVGMANEVQDKINELTVKVSENTANIATLTTNVAVNKQGIETLNTEVNNLKGEDAKINALISTLQSVLTTLQTELATVKAELTNTKAELTIANTNLAAVSAELTEFKNIAITNIKGTDNEIKVTQDGNTATVGFADDAYFVAGA